VEKDSLHQRGIDVDDLVEGLEPIDHGKVSELMSNHHLQLIF
jgi:sulfur relay (sulfurtransferase) DsrF/TusC family protein